MPGSLTQLGTQYVALLSASTTVQTKSLRPQAFELLELQPSRQKLSLLSWMHLFWMLPLTPHCVSVVQPKMVHMFIGEIARQTSPFTQLLCTGDMDRPSVH